MKSPQRIVPLTIFLIKKSMADGDVIDLELKREVRSFQVKLEDRQVGTLYVKQSPIHPPSWASFFANAVDLTAKDLRNASVSAIFLTRTAGRLFAISFGHGRHILNPGAFEERFGLRVTLNSIKPDELRAVDITTLESNPFHGKRQASRAAPLGEFGLNLDQDVLRAATGKPLDERLGTQMAGTDSLTVRVRTDLAGLKKLLARYLEKSEELTYREHGFAWVDHVAEVRDSALATELTEMVAVALKKRNPKNIWAAIPEVIDWTMFDHFRVGQSSAEHDDVTIDAMLNALEGDSISIELIRRRQVFCMAQGNAHPVRRWSFLQCLAAEMKIGEKLYILNAGTWYCIDTDYAKQVDDAVAEIPSAVLPISEWGAEDESDYNERMAKNSKGKLALMDRVMVKHSGMASPIEFCDLLTNDNRMIHVKRYGQSSVLSHLFAQGLVSGASILGDVAFRNALNIKLPDSHKLIDIEKRIDAGGYEVCYAIGSSESGRVTLPFFSRVTLRNAYRTLTQSYGFKVSLTKIQVSKLNALI